MEKLQRIQECERNVEERWLAGSPELREIYRQNGLAMPPMTLEDLNRRQQAIGKPVTVEPIQHLAPVLVPPAPAVDFAPLLIARPSLAPTPTPTPNPTHVQAIVEQHRQHKQITGRGYRYGLKGFCPVALKDQGKLLDTRPEFNVTYRGRVILLSSKEACAAFRTRPEAYLPAAEGIDLVSRSQRRRRLGRLDHATWYRGRLFLFVTKANLIEFQKQPERFTR